tara:strand:+ start:10027 stop:10998 length:972 start_codon:yes stop_codon:yes gene_type:complete
MSNFSNLKKQSGLGSLTQKLVKEVEKMNNTNSNSDERFWKPEMGKDGVGSAIIRFLPAPDGEELPWVKIYSHGFQGTGGWYIENSLTTLGQKDPVSESNRTLWNSGNDKDKETARARKRKLSYYSNIYVVKDPAHPENEGRVFLFKYGKKIFDKILNAMQPEFEDEEPINPFDFWAGANFRLKIRKVEGYWNYDKSEFDSVKPLLNDDDAMEAIWKKEHSLEEMVAPTNFKTYEQLEARLNAVLGLNKPKARRYDEEELENESEGRGSFTPNFKSKEENVMEELEKSYHQSKSAPTSSESKSSSDDEDEVDTLSYFQTLADSE